MSVFFTSILVLGLLTASPGEQLVFSSGRGGNSNLYLVNSDGSGLKQITFGSSEKWSPRVINRNEVSFLEQTDKGIIRKKINIKNGKITRLSQASPCVLDDKNAQISPDKRRLLFQCGNDVFVSGLRMQNARNLTKSQGGVKNFKGT